MLVEVDLHVGEGPLRTVSRPRDGGPETHGSVPVPSNLRWDCGGGATSPLGLVGDPHAHAPGFVTRPAALPETQTQEQIIEF